MLEKIKNSIMNGCLNEKFEKMYCSKEVAKLQCKRYTDAIDCFEKLYGSLDIEIYSAPGRTEVGGNHTDHQNGKVLAASVNLDALAIASKANENIVKIKSEGYREIELSLENLDVVEAEKGTTLSLVRGVAAAMKQKGYNVGGFKAYITSSVLSGSGLSSSAAFEVLIATILSNMYNEGKISSIEIAQIGQEAENKYFGKPCGLLDQMASSVGGLIHIDFAEKTPKTEKIDVDFGKFNHSLCIVDTKGSHSDLTDEYAAVPKEMCAVAEVFGKEYLSEVEYKDFHKNISKIREKTGDRAVLRALHWYAENIRVDRQKEALEKGDFDGFKELIKESGNSSFKYLQNVYASKNAHNQAVSLALALSEEILSEKGVSRVHGGGFAGTIQAFVPNDMVDVYKHEMEKVFGENACYVLGIRPMGGIKVL